MNMLGRRYKCPVCETECLCTKVGQGTASCCGKEMVQQEPKALPSSD